MFKVCRLTSMQHFDFANHPPFYFGFSDTHISCFPFAVVIVIDISVFIQTQI